MLPKILPENYLIFLYFSYLVDTFPKTLPEN